MIGAEQERTTTAPRTQAVRAGVGNDTAYGAVMPPLHLSSNFTFAGLGQKDAAAHDENWFLGGQQHVHGLGDLLAVGSRFGDG